MKKKQELVVRRDLTEMRKGRGRPSKWDDAIIDKVYDYMEKCTNSMETDEAKLPTQEGLAITLGVTRQTILNWGKEHPEFRHALDMLMMVYKDLLIAGGLSGKYNSSFAKFLASSEHGMVERQEVHHDGISFNVINYAKESVEQAILPAQKPIDITDGNTVQLPAKGLPDSGPQVS